MSNIAHKIETMLVIQDELNQVVDPNWRDRRFRWEDAITIEAVELFDHLPWKWWKSYSKPVDRSQVVLEAIDIWHFILSRVINEFDIDYGVEFLLDYFEDHEAEETIDWDHVKEDARSFLREVTYDNEDPDVLFEPTYVEHFAELLSTLGVTFDELYTLYVAKTQLNRLRWANDYGGSYIKTWGGQEDNVWLAEYVKTLDVDAPDFKDQVYAGLVAKYEEVKKAASTGLSEE